MVFSVNASAFMEWVLPSFRANH